MEAHELRRWMMLHGWTVERLAERMSVDPSTVSRWRGRADAAPRDARAGTPNIFEHLERRADQARRRRARQRAEPSRGRCHTGDIDDRNSRWVLLVGEACGDCTSGRPGNWRIGNFDTEPIEEACHLERARPPRCTASTPARSAILKEACPPRARPTTKMHREHPGTVGD